MDIGSKPHPPHPWGGKKSLAAPPEDPLHMQTLTSSSERFLQPSQMSASKSHTGEQTCKQSSSCHPLHQPRQGKGPVPNCASAETHPSISTQQQDGRNKLGSQHRVKKLPKEAVLAATLHLGPSLVSGKCWQPRSSWGWATSVQCLCNLGLLSQSEVSQLLLQDQLRFIALNEAGGRN